jgi:hypothetical protein
MREQLPMEPLGGRGAYVDTRTDGMRQFVPNPIAHSVIYSEFAINSFDRGRFWQLVCCAW